MRSRWRPGPTVEPMVPDLLLNNGVTMPALGFGGFQSPPEETAAAVETAMRVGYRHVDTAAAYGNERQVGEGIRRAGVDPLAVLSRPRCGSATTATTRPCTRSRTR